MKYAAALILLMSFLAHGQTPSIFGGQTIIAQTPVAHNGSYTILASDVGQTTVLTCNTTCAWTLPTSGSAGFLTGSPIYAQNIGSGVLTITTTTYNFFGSAITPGLVLTINAGQNASMISNGTSGWMVNLAVTSSGGLSYSGTPTATALVTSASSSAVQTPSATATLDTSGNVILPGALTAGTSLSGVSGAIDWVQGTDPGSTTANAFSWIAPTSIPSAYRWKVPSADAAGAIISDGAATPGTLSITPVATTSTANAIAKMNGSGLLSPTMYGNRRIATMVFDGGGSALSGTQDACTDIPFAATIKGVTLMADQSGNATVDVRTVVYASYTSPSSASTITASATPTFTSAAKYQDTTLTGWTTAVAANSAMCFHLTSPATINWLMVDVFGTIQ